MSSASRAQAVSLLGCLLLSAFVSLPRVLPAQGTTLNVSHDLVALGIAGTNMTPNQPALDARPLLLAAVEYAKSHGISTVTADPGTYYFKSLQWPDRHLQLNQVNNITIDLKGSNVILSHTFHVGITLDNSANAVLQNFTIDYADVPFTQLRVEAVDPANRQVQFSVPPGWRHPNVFNAPPIPSWSSIAMFAFVFRDGRPVADIPRLEVNRPFTGNAFTFTNPGLPWTTTEVIGRIRAGDTIALAARGGGDPIYSTECTGCTFRNIRIYSGGVNGIVLLESAASLVERVYVMPRPGTDRLLSVGADGITLAQPRAGNTIRLSRAIRTGDDGFSPHSLMLGTVASQPGPRRLIVQRHLFDRVLNGSPVVFQRPSDGVMLGTAVIATQNPPPTQWVNGGTITIDFTADLPAGLVGPGGAVLYTSDPNQRGSNTVLERNTVQDQVFARGISLWGLVNSEARGNYVLRAQMSAVIAPHRMLAHDWMAPPLQNMSISRNVLDGANRFGGGILDALAAINVQALQADSQLMLVSPHQNVHVTGNFIADSGRSAVRIQNTSGGSVAGNRLLNPSDRPSSGGFWEDTFEPFMTQFRNPIVIAASNGITSTDNVVDKTSPRLLVSDTQSRVLAAYAPGSIVRLNGYGAGQGPSPHVAISDADGMTLPVPIQSVSTSYLDVQLPANTAFGGGVITMTRGSTTWVGTLFVDGADNVPLANGCSYIVSPASTTMAHDSHTLSILVVTQPGCAYGVKSFDANVSAAPHSPGPGVVQLTVTGPPRAFVVDVAGERLALTKTGFTDVPLFSQLSVIRAAHIIELRQHVDAIRAKYSLAPYPWTTAAPLPGQTVVKAQDVRDLRLALELAYQAAGRTPPAYTDPQLPAGGIMKAIHILELRAAVVAIE